MATLGTQNISTSYSQVLKTFGSDIVGPTLAAVSSGNEAGVSALQISTTGVKSSGTFAVDGASRLLGPVTFGSSNTFSTGTTTIATASISTASISTATISTATISTATIGTIASTTITNTGLVTVGTLEIGATGPNITNASFGTAAFTSATVSAHNGADATTGTFTLTGAALGDIVIGSLNSLGSTTGTVNVGLSLYPTATNVVRYSIQNQGATAGTIPAGTFFATAMRFTT